MKPNYAKIGFFIVAAISLIVATLVWIGGISGKRHEFLVETFFGDDVSGLDVGSSVNYRGVRVGSVRRISFIGAEYEDVSAADEQKIYVLMALDSRMFVPDDSTASRAEEKIRALVEQGLRAKVSASGITGLSHIDINFTTPVDRSEEVVAWHPAHVFIPSHPGLLQNLQTSLEQLVNEMNEADIGGALSNLTGIVSETRSLLVNVNNMVESGSGTLAETMEAIRTSAENTRELTRELMDNPGALLRDNPPAPLPETY